MVVEDLVIMQELVATEDQVHLDLMYLLVVDMAQIETTNTQAV